MENIIVDMFHGDYSAFEKSYYPCPNYSIAFERMEKLEKELLSTLPEPLKAKFIEFRDTFQKLSDLSSEQDFVAGYRIGAQLAMAALS